MFAQVLYAQQPHCLGEYKDFKHTMPNKKIVEKCEQQHNKCDCHKNNKISFNNKT